MTTQTKTQTLGDYLLDRLHDLKVSHIFGVPGDFSIRFCQLLEKDKKITFVGTTREDTAGFAADGYARRHGGLGVVLVTHGVGALSIVNPIAGANAESSPVLVISGAPGIRERNNQLMIHHSFGDEGSQKRIFENFTCCSRSIKNISDAAFQIEEVIENVWQKKKPGYLEIPRDMIDKEIQSYGKGENSFCRYPTSNTETLNEALEETLCILNKASNPVFLAGVELHRFGLQKDLIELIETSQIPAAATIMGKSVINEHHPHYLGIYQGRVGIESTRKLIEEADVLVTLGVMFTDINLGMYTANFDTSRLVQVNQGKVIIRHHEYSNIMLKDFLRGLINLIKPRPDRKFNLKIKEKSEPKKLTIKKETISSSNIIQCLNKKITSEMVVVCDTGDCLFAADELLVHDQTAFFASAFYTTMGFSVPAALGVACASPDVRPLILVGDGAFQMTGTELSSFKKMNFHPIVIIFNNKGYETERVILDGAFNDIPDWNYGEICRLVGYGKGYKAKTPKEFELILDNAIQEKNQMHVINVLVRESSLGMRRLASEISRCIQKSD